MSTTTGPFTLTLLALESLPNPGLQGQNFVNVQLQNSSGFVLQVLAGGLSYTIQPFFAQTVPLSPDGTPVLVTPTQDPSNTGTQDTLTLVWLLPGESPPIVDGSLTAAALAAGLAGAGISGHQVISQSAGVASMAQQAFNLGNAILWNWGWQPQFGNPASGGAMFLGSDSVATPHPPQDFLTLYEGASNRLAGLNMTVGPGDQDCSITNYFNITVAFWITYSLVG